jgi:hypothetical protein
MLCSVLLSSTQADVHKTFRSRSYAFVAEYRLPLGRELVGGVSMLTYVDA